MAHALTCATLSHVRRSSRTLALAAVMLSAAVALPAMAESPCGCSADFNGSGSVSAADLGLMLGDWGSVDSQYDVTGDGAIDAADLGVLLGQWGPCGAPTNDSCASAIVLPTAFFNLVPFCTANADTDGPANSECDVSNSDQIFGDVWYKVTAPATGMLDVSTCGANYDSRLAVYAPGLFGTTCPQSGILTAVLAGCNDDDVECPTNPLNSRVQVPVTQGKTYTIRVGGYLTNEGTGNLSVQFHEKGDLCSDPIDVFLSSFDGPDGTVATLTGSTANATAGEFGDITTCAFNDSKDIWFRVHIDCSLGGQVPVSLSASTCHPGTNFDTTLAIYQGSCDSLVELECNDDHTFSSCTLGGVNRKSFVSIDPDNSAQSFLVRLSGFSGGTGNYEIRFTLGCL